jgi:MFS transporter, DHA2 family, methylenomycin A resistance protein
MHSPYVVRPDSQRLTLVATSLGFVLIVLDVTVVNVALERIQQSLGTDVTGLQWMVNAYTLVFASFLLTTGALVDRLGAKRIFLIGFTLFTAASLACGLAGSVTALVVARVAQGFGAALCLPAALALLNVSFPEAASRARAVSIWAGLGGVAVAAGPVVGGLMVDRLGWPSIFFLNLPFGVLGIWLTVAHAPPAPRTPDRGLDLFGQLLAVLALAGLTLAFTEAGALGWMHPIVLAGFVCFLVATPLFLLIEASGGDPMLPLSLFRSAEVSVSCFVGLAVNFAFYGLMFALSLFFQMAKGYSPFATGLAFLPMTALVAVANLVAGMLTARFGPKLPMTVGQALAGAGYLALAGIDAQTPYSAIVGPLLAAGVGAALTVPSMTAAVLSSAGKQRAGTASGTLNAARQLGAVVGIGVFGSLMSAQNNGSVGSMRIALMLAALTLGVGCLVSLLGLQSNGPTTKP